ncbi:MAG: ABC-type transport system permease protein [uncultured bacterium]|nr:MAG: ABC-type transport system permease protein [uncultured bacterium]HLD46145.1 ABC transporter permease [bacterium]
MTSAPHNLPSLPPNENVQESVRSLLQRWGAVVWDFLDYAGGLCLLAGRTVQALFLYPLDLRYVIRQLYEIGVKTLTLSSLVAIFTGMVMALQLIVGLKRFGLELYTGQIVGVAITRELGPVLTALMVASRVGSGIAAEIGSMEVSEQILAIRAMGGSPIAKLVLPRILVTTLAAPMLTIIAIFIGIVGGMFVTMTEAGMTSRFYFDQIQSTVQIYDFLSGVGKTVFFGFFIGCIACYQGLNTKKGTKGVGDATTKTVVICSIVIFISDFFLTKLFLLF